ncbi:MAG: hypothetical protein CMH27_11020 [Micavibrio sp.]|nr:hypothetical protein [Micavibrio sp.]|tara:strand:- start:5558 stop:6685 length:1128 start_codon:yes stop_codon:yes gene_type:complete
MDTLDSAQNQNARDIGDNEIRNVEDHIYHEKIEHLLKEAEEYRLKKMGENRSREFVSLTVTLTSVVLGAGGFAWYLLIMGNILLALLCMVLAIAPPLLLMSWVRQPVQDYKKNYKSTFMPRLADALGGLKYYPTRGVGRKVLARTGVVPAHGKYMAEDCFSGHYKGAKITFSEARLSHPKKSNDLIFDGIFVLIEIKNTVFHGHSVITADASLAKRLSKKLTPLPPGNNAFSRHFTILTNDEKNRPNLENDQLLKEISETSALFGNAQISAAFFQGKYIFMAIPAKEDMFEASDVYIPITTSESAMRCKQEIEQILSIIDIIDVYHGPENRQNAAPATVSEQPEQTDMQPGPDHTDASTNEEDAPLPETPAKKDD